ncbi:hypothetical protein CHK_0718 [Christensenella hongkongensis]|uniref:Uncharacterized protein n=1 Tax=Christensenella hongkongensis TaxID=270498 RepID=A0A0M2NMY7_9FIRM|nr:hypothetical protein CHK_0718 [Christensenella hongkongensis]
MPKIIPASVALTPSEIKNGVKNGRYRYNENQKKQVVINNINFFNGCSSYQ